MKTYDAFIPIGETCIATYNLRRQKLQYESLPFDWVWIRDIKIVEYFLKTHFTNFMRKDALVYKGPDNQKTDIYVNTLNGVEFWHDFPINVPLDDCYDEVYNKYQRRISRLYEQIEKSRRILFFRVVKIKEHTEVKPGETCMFSRNVSEEDKIAQEFSELQNLYPNKKIDLLLLYVWNTPHDIVEHSINKNIRVFEIYCNDDLGWAGDVELIGKQVLNDYRLSLKQLIIYKCKTRIFKFKKFAVKIGALFGSSYCKSIRQKQKDIMRRD